MRAISLWQPWASAVAFNSKLIETRHWSTAYRGPLAIHAAKRRVIGELIGYQCTWQWKGVFYELLHDTEAKLWEALPFGAVVAVTMLVDCRPTEHFTIGELDVPARPAGETTALYDWTERLMGDFSPGRFGWKFENTYKLPEPIPFIGRQGFFHVPDELLSPQVRERYYNEHAI